MCASVKIAILLLFYELNFVFNLQIIPEGTNVTYANKKYMEWAYTELKQYGVGRSSRYFVNVAGLTKQSWANNVTIHITFFDHVNKKYQRSFVDLHFKFCDLVQADPYIGKMLIKAGITCPSPPGEYRLMNLTVPAERFPNVWPFEQGRVDVDIILTDTTITIVKGYLEASFRTSRAKTSERGKQYFT